MNRAKLPASVVACRLAGVLGAVLTGPGIPAWPAALNKPAFPAAALSISIYPPNR